MAMPPSRSQAFTAPSVTAPAHPHESVSTPPGSTFTPTAMMWEHMLASIARLEAKIDGNHMPVGQPPTTPTFDTEPPYGTGLPPSFWAPPSGSQALSSAATATTLPPNLGFATVNPTPTPSSFGHPRASSSTAPGYGTPAARLGPVPGSAPSAPTASLPPPAFIPFDQIVGVEEDNSILFHEKIRLEDFSSPYHATVLYSSPEQGKLTIKADLIFEEIIGIDLHQKVIVTQPLEKTAVPKFRQKEISLFVPKAGRNIKDLYDRASLPASNELMEISSSMPSFKLIDEDSENDKPVAVTEDDDDDCRIITTKTVFDHIREKAKSLPVLPMSDATASPSLEAFTLIKKHTRDPGGDSTPTILIVPLFVVSWFPP